jgi:hypothetical protein
MNHDINYYTGVVDELEEEFDNVVTLFEEMEKMVRPTWSLPFNFTDAIKDVMAIVDTAPSDAINSGAIALSGSQPIFNVTPFAANPAEYDRVQILEDAISWHFDRSNRRGDGSVMFEKAWSSLLYNTICTRTDDLAHILPKDSSKWTPLQRRAWAHGRFIHKQINPKYIRYIHSDMGLVLVAHVENVKLKDAMAHWELYEGNKTEEGKKASQALADLKRKAEEMVKGGSPLKDLFIEQVYCIDDDKLMIWGNLTTNTTPEDSVKSHQYIFADQDNPYGFIPWSIRVAGSRLESDIAYRVNPLLAPLYWSGSWDKLNLAKSIVFSEPIRRARSPRAISITASGDPLQADYEQGADIAGRTGDEYKPFQPVTMDPNALAVLQSLESAMNRTTGASMIGDTTKISSNTPFATFSAMVKVALSRLDRQREIMADSCVDDACNMLWWVDKTKVPLSSYATADKKYRSGTQVPMGTQTSITPDDYDLNNLGIDATVHPKTASDEMEQINKAIMLSTKLNVPVSDELEKLGYKNIPLMYERWVKETLASGEVQAKIAGMVAEAQAAGQASVQQQLQQNGSQPGGPTPPNGSQGPQSPQGAGGGISQQAYGAMGGTQGTNPAFAGQSPAAGAPSVTRETIQGGPRVGSGQ